MESIKERVARLDWQSIAASLDRYGYGTTGPMLSARECAALIELYGDERRFRRRIEMARFRYGVGEYKYFAAPLPSLVQQLRTLLYPRLAPIASRWTKALGAVDAFPATLHSFLDSCRDHGQTRPTPLMLRYEAEGYNCLHQDLYGEIAFPLQFTCVLSRRNIDYEGGDFLLMEQRPRAQSRGEAIALEQGEAIIFTTRFRPVQGAGGVYRVNIRHGVSRVRAGIRYTLGVIFHDAA